MIPAARRLERATRRALVQKERRESRAALVAGLVIFLGLPILWTVLYAVVDPQHEAFPGFAATLFAAGGGLYAAVIAAQSVCRDFGRAPGEFLLARPVTILEVLRAKAAVGFRLIGGLALAVLALETTLAAGTKLPQDFADVIHLWLISTGINMLAYWSAFAAAAITRRTLSGVLVAGLFLALLAAIPLTSSASTDFAAWIADAAKYPLYWTYGVVLGITDHSAADPYIAGTLGLPFSNPVYGWGWFYGPVSLPVTTVVAGLFVVVAAIIRFLFTLLLARRRLQQRASTGSIAMMLLFLGVSAVSLPTHNLLPLGVLLAVVLAASLGRGVAVIACRSQRALRLSTKSLAWTIGLALILIFTLAMNEVGANAPVSSTFWASGGMDVRAQHPKARRFAIGKRRLAVRNGGSLMLYNISMGGEIARHRGLVIDEGNIIVTEPGSIGSVPVFDEHDELYVIMNWAQWDYEKIGRVDDPPELANFQIDLFRVKWETGICGPARDLSLPEKIPHESAFVYDAAIQGDELYVLYMFNRPRLPDGSIGPSRAALARFRLAGDRPNLVHAVELVASHLYTPRSGGYHFSRGADGRVYAVGNWNPYVDPARLHGTMPEDRIAPGAAPGFYFAPFMISPALTCVGDRLAFTVHSSFRWGDPKVLKMTSWGITIGGVKSSPWAWLFRSDYPILVSAGRGRVWEVHEGSAICYDVTDPHRPKRIAHVNSHRILNAASGPDFLLLDHGPGFSIVRHPQSSR